METPPFTALNGARIVDATTALAFSPDSQHFVSADNDGRLFLWRTKPYSAQSLLPGPDLDGTSPAIYSADGSQVITATGDGRIVFWDAHTGAKLGDMPDGLGTAAFVSSLALTPDGKTLAVGDSSGNITLWNLATKQSEGTPLFAATSKDEISPTVEGISFSHDGTKLLASDYSGRVTLWDPTTGKLLHDFTQSFPSTTDQGFSRTATISADGNPVVIGSQSSDANAPAFKVYVLDTQKLLNGSSQSVIKILAGFGNYIDGAAFSPDGSLLAAADEYGTVIVWNTATWQPITTLSLPLAGQIFGDAQAYIFRPNFTADGSKLVVAGYNHILIWDTHTHQLAMPLLNEIGYFNNVAINPADTQMAVAFLSGMVGIQSLEPNDWQTQACAIAHRNLRRDEWAQLIGTDLPYQAICPGLPLP